MTHTDFITLTRLVAETVAEYRGIALNNVESDRDMATPVQQPVVDMDWDVDARLAEISITDASRRAAARQAAAEALWAGRLQHVRAYSAGTVRASAPSPHRQVQRRLVFGDA